MKENKFHVMRTLLCLVLTVAMLFAVLAVSVSAAMPRVTPSRLTSFNLPDDQYVRAIVVLEGDAVVDLGVDPQGATALAHEKALLKTQNRFLNRVNKQDSSARHYTELFNGVAIDATAGELKEIEKMSGVKAVYLANTYSIPEYDVVRDETIQAQYAALMTGAATLTAAGFDGDGVVVAVIDTGVNLIHEVLQPNDLMQNPALSESDVAAVNTVGKGKYVSEKIPFSFDYYDWDNDCTDENGHGSHVSGIIGGYKADGDAVEFSGSAPAVQILGLKVFGATGGTSSDIYFNALEDAYRLGADVVNMSLGSPSGFTYDYSLESDLYGDIYAKLDRAGVAVFCSAGNEYNMGFAAINLPTQLLGTSYVQGATPDYGVVGTPSTFPSNVSVAAYNNAVIRQPAVCFDGVNTFYATDPNANTSLEFRKNFEGVTVGLVYLPGLGELSDYEGLDVTGKLVAVDRGSINFQTKIDNAAAMGAVGCIIVNNSPTPLNMSVENLTIPAICVDMNAKAVLSALNGTEITITYGSEVANPQAGTMCDFSSWGPTTDLQFKPQITGVGGSVYSSVSGSSDAYDVYSGTSMSCPNVVGSYAALLSYLRKVYPEMDKYTMSKFAEDLLLSTSTVLDNGESFYSVRQQGTGLANVVAAATAPAYITNADQSAGYDADREGIIKLSYNVVSLSDKTEFYLVSPSAVMDQPTMFNGLDNVYNTLSPMMLDGAFDWTVETIYEDGTTDDGDVFALEPGASATVNVTIVLSSAVKNLLNYYENGGYVDGFVFFYDYEEIVAWQIGAADVPYDKFHGSFLSFYGDWLDAPALETYSIFDLLDAIALLDYYGLLDEGYSFFDVLEDFNINYNEAYLYDQASGDAVELGTNPFSNQHFFVDENRNAFSTELSDADLYFMDSVIFAPSILRNCRNLIMTVTDAVTGEIYYIDDTPFAAKDALSSDGSSYQKRTTFLWDGTDMTGNYVPSGTKANIVFESILDHPDATRRVEWATVVTVDYTAPKVAYAYDAETGILKITASDEQYLAYLNVYDPAWEVDYVLDEYDTAYAGQAYTYEIDLSDYAYNRIFIDVVDYATNASSYVIWLDEGSVSNIPVEVSATESEGAIIEGDAEANLYDYYQFTVTVEDGYCVYEDQFSVTVNGEEADLIGIYDTTYVFGYYIADVEPLTIEVAGILAHDIQPNVIVDATCCGNGYIEYVCTNCGYLDHHEVTEPTGHVPGEYVVKSEATCDSCGVSVSYCEVCGQIVDVASEEASGHAIGAGVVLLKPTCDTEGLKVYTCTTCNEVVSIETIPALGHTEGAWIVTKDPTCTEAGERIQICATCGAVISIEEIAETGHVIGKAVVEKAATCTEMGLSVSRCEVCGEEMISEMIRETGHTAGEWIVTKQPTCTEEGQKIRKCEECGETIQTEAIAALGHTEGEWEVTKEPTLSAEGEKVLKCSVCGAIIKTETIAKKQGILGDVTGNGKLDASDYLLLKRYILKQATLTADQLERADVTLDGKVTSSDYLLLKRMVMGKA